MVLFLSWFILLCIFSESLSIVNFLDQYGSDEIYYWDEEDLAHSRDSRVGRLEIFSDDDISASKGSALSAFIEESALLHSKSDPSPENGPDTGNPQDLSPDSLQCYCKFKKPKVQTVPASRFNNAGESFLLPGENNKDTKETGSLLQVSEVEGGEVSREDHSRFRRSTKGAAEFLEENSNAKLLKDNTRPFTRKSKYQRGYEAAMKDMRGNVEKQDENDWASAERLGGGW
eukprot:g2262.t1